MTNQEAANTRNYLNALSKDLELAKTKAEIRAIKIAIRTAEFKLSA